MNQPARNILWVSDTAGPELTNLSLLAREFNFHHCTDIAVAGQLSRSLQAAAVVIDSEKQELRALDFCNQKNKKSVLK